LIRSVSIVLQRPKRSLGQNFLVDGNLQRKIVEAFGPQPDDDVLEIGPGKGALTRHLAGKCKSLILVELDRDLAARLGDEYGGIPGIEVINADILEVRLGAVTPFVAELRVLGNIPYNITSPILFHLLTPPRPRDLLIMVQKEVGDRILAAPGTSAFGALTVGVQSVAVVERVLRVPASAFRPRPAVDSVVIRLQPVRPEPLTPSEQENLRSLTRLAFQQRRKQFQTILRNRPELGLSHDQVRAVEKATGFDLRRRPETFSPEDFIVLSGELRGFLER
jgi:16S rRNA (adenine1518-N6/adenine1519-N6)-dimethyltransferase